MTHLSPQLRELVDQSVTLLGEVLRSELGAPAYARIEKLRRRMTRLRSAGENAADRVLRAELARLRRAGSRRNLQTAKAFALMLEVMNACENAYRSHEIRHRAETSGGEKPEAVRSGSQLDPADDFLKKTVAYYQSASDSFRHRLIGLEKEFPASLNLRVFQK